MAIICMCTVYAVLYCKIIIDYLQDVTFYTTVYHSVAIMLKAHMNEILPYTYNYVT